MRRRNKAADPVQKKQGTSRILALSGPFNKPWQTLASLCANIYALENEILLTLPSSA